MIELVKLLYHQSYPDIENIACRLVVSAKHRTIAENLRKRTFCVVQGMCLCPVEDGFECSEAELHWDEVYGIGRKVIKINRV